MPFDPPHFGPTTGGGIGSLFDLRSRYGLVPDCRYAADGGSTSGTNVITSTLLAFAAADVGRAISIAGAFRGTIIGWTAASPNQVTVSGNATATVGSAAIVIGTDNTNALQRAGADWVASLGSLNPYLSPGQYYVRNQFASWGNGSLLTKGTILRGDGPNTSVFVNAADQGTNGPFIGGLPRHGASNTDRQRGLQIRDIGYISPGSAFAGDFVTGYQWRDLLMDNVWGMDSAGNGLKGTFFQCTGAGEGIQLIDCKAPKSGRSDSGSPAVVFSRNDEGGVVQTFPVDGLIDGCDFTGCYDIPIFLFGCKGFNVRETHVGCTNRMIPAIADHDGIDNGGFVYVHQAGTDGIELRSLGRAGGGRWDGHFNGAAGLAAGTGYGLRQVIENATQTYLPVGTYEGLFGVQSANSAGDIAST